MIEQRVTLRYNAQQIPAIVQAVQGDTGRDVIFELADYEIPAGATANYYIDKPDGNAVYNSAEVLSSTEILAHLTEQALAVPGRNNGQVRILSDDEVITSFDFVLEVEAFRGILRLQSETEVNIFDEALQDAAEDAIAEIQAQTPVVTGMQNSIAPTYSSSSTYAVGDYVMYNAQLYKCITAITTAEAWTAAHWSQVPLANDVSNLKSALRSRLPLTFQNIEEITILEKSDLCLGTSGNDPFSIMNTNVRIRTLSPIKVYLDDVFVFTSGDSIPTCYVSYYDENGAFLRERAITSGVDNIIENSGYIVPVFRRNNETLSVADYDCQFVLKSYKNKAIDNRLQYSYKNDGQYTLKKSDLSNGMPSEINKDILTDSVYRISSYVPIFVEDDTMIHFDEGDAIKTCVIYKYALDGSYINKFALPSGSNYTFADSKFIRVEFNANNNHIIPDEYDAAFILKKTAVKTVMIEPTRNLFNYNTIYLGTNYDGNFGKTFAISKPIPVNTGLTKVCCRINGDDTKLAYRMCAYTDANLSNQSFIQFIGNWHSGKSEVFVNFSIFNNVNYIRIMLASLDDISVINASDIADARLQVEFNDESTDYIMPETAVDLIARNELNISNSKNLFDVSTTSIGKNLYGNNQIDTAVSNAIPLTIGNKYIVISLDSVGLNGKTFRVAGYSNDSLSQESFIRYYGSEKTNTDSVPINLNSYDDTNYIRIVFFKTNSTAITRQEIADLKMQIEYGIAPTHYAPYGDSVDRYAISEDLERFETTKRFAPYSRGYEFNEINTEGFGQYDRCNILFFTDSHIDFNEPIANRRNVENTIEYANNAPFPISAIVHGGDVITPRGELTKQSQKNIFSIFTDMLKKSKYPVIFTKGNHDINDWENTPSNTFNDADWGEMWYNYAETRWGIVRQTKSSGQKSTWNYYDIEDHRIRIICLDGQDTDKETVDASGHVLYHGTNSWYLSNEQINWLINTALNFDSKSNKDWGVIVVTHQKPVYYTKLVPAYESSAMKFARVCKAFNEQGTYSNTYEFPTDHFYDLSFSADFTRYSQYEKPPHMICWLVGHEHIDEYATVYDNHQIVTAQNACITVVSDQRLIRLKESSTQNLFDLVSIDTKTRKIRIVRHGAGITCFGGGGDRFMPDGLSF